MIIDVTSDDKRIYLSTQATINNLVERIKKVHTSFRELILAFSKMKISSVDNFSHVQ
ncbi:hypothetical protein HALLA_05765 [Halostagnicola larsenii XH-48]|uniref:Uncharacterized protein n=1 Tax=Halostagnicola larsenii XH-48 TaxID=797299 RepID=W0JUK2_9EURY|nr:hypothetical protein HALLA_05765 [Halostagnicola larsenii XH-48]